MTIAIPSYNRGKLLIENLKAIAERLPDWVHLLIIDNASIVPIQVDDALMQTLSQRNVTFSVVRNAANIGGGANILRCFEEVQTDWFFLCGDDDLLDPSKLNELRNLALSRSDLAIVKFSSGFHQYDSTIVGTGLADLLRAQGAFNNLLFMSTYMFNQRLCNEFVRFGYLMNAAYAPHLAIAMLAARKHAFALSPIFGTRASPDDAQWSPVDVVLCAYQLSDLPLAADERRLLVRKVYATHNVGRELLDIVTILNKPGLHDEGRFLRRKAIRTHLFFGKGAKRIVALLLLVATPLLGQAAQRLIARWYQRASGRTYLRTFVSRHTGL